MKIVVTTTLVDPEPLEREIPDDWLPEFVHEIARVVERRYRHERFKTAVRIVGLPLAAGEEVTTGEVTLRLEEAVSKLELPPVHTIPETQENPC